LSQFTAVDHKRVPNQLFQRLDQKKIMQS